MLEKGGCIILASSFFLSKDEPSTNRSEIIAMDETAYRAETSEMAQEILHRFRGSGTVSARTWTMPEWRNRQTQGT